MEKKITILIEKERKPDEIYKKKLEKKKEIEQLLKEIEKDSQNIGPRRCNLESIFTVLCLLALLILFLIIF